MHKGSREIALTLEQQAKVCKDGVGLLEEINAGTSANMESTQHRVDSVTQLDDAASRLREAVSQFKI